MKKKVMITGTNRGIGFEFVKRYLEEGWDVIATCRDPSKADKLHSLSLGSPMLRVEKLDVKEKDDYIHLKEKLSNQTLDLIIANAGIYGPRDLNLNQIEAD